VNTYVDDLLKGLAVLLEDDPDTVVNVLARMTATRTYQARAALRRGSSFPSRYAESSPSVRVASSGHQTPRR
jgi:lipopolysaccharide biosynthesis regulator YciM